MKPMFLGIAGLTTLLALIPTTISPRTLFTTAQTVPAEPSDTQAQRFNIRLTLSSSTDLKVREGDEIAKGEVLADRTRDRVRLDAQKRQIQLRIDRLKQPLSGTPAAKPILNVSSLKFFWLLRAFGEVGTESALNPCPDVDCLSDRTPFHQKCVRAKIT